MITLVHSKKGRKYLLKYVFAKSLWWWCLSGIVANHKRGIRSIELIWTITYHVGHTILELFRLIRINDKSTIVELVGNTDITVSQLHRIGWRWIGIAVCALIGEVLEDNMFVRSHRQVYDYWSSIAASGY